MSPRELRRRVDQCVQSLSPERVQVALDFLAYLKERESNEATEELLRIPGFLVAFEKAKKRSAKRRLSNWRRVRRDV